MNPFTDAEFVKKCVLNIITGNICPDVVDKLGKD